MTDVLYVLMAFVLVGSVLAAEVFFGFIRCRNLMVDSKVQFDLVAVLGLLSLFTHIHAFWVAALILALIEIPEF